MEEEEALGRQSDRHLLAVVGQTVSERVDARPIPLVKENVRPIALLWHEDLEDK